MKHKTLCNISAPYYLKIGHIWFFVVPLLLHMGAQEAHVVQTFGEIVRHIITKSNMHPICLLLFTILKLLSANRPRTHLIKMVDTPHPIGVCQRQWEQIQKTTNMCSLLYLSWWHVESLTSNNVKEWPSATSDGTINSVINSPTIYRACHFL